MTRFTLRSVKLLTELPACSKNAQKSIEKNVRMNTTYMRWRGMRSSLTVCKPKIDQCDEAGQEQDQSGGLAGFLQHDGEDFADAARCP